MAEVVIIGSGVVGGSTGKGFAAAGHAVRFVDRVVGNPVRERVRVEGHPTG